MYTTQLIPGNRYKIRYRLEDQRRPREAVLDYLGTGGADGTRLMFSARPLAGTIVLHPGDITDAKPVLAGVKVSVPKKVT